VSEPIIVVSDDVDLFISVKRAEQYLEPPEVRAGLIVLDATGRRLRAVVARRGLAEVVRIETDPAGGADLPALRSALVRLITGVARVRGEMVEDVSDLPLEQLIARALPYVTR
jgi:hypothetical protein